MTGFAPVAVRGCGTRKPGGVYLMSELGPGGEPVENFLVDAPQPIPPSFTLPKRGVTLATAAGNRPPWVFDWIGEEYYPNVLDFVEEVRLYGMSRRVSAAAFDFSKLRPGSRHACVHARAIIKNAEQYQLSRTGVEEGYYWCPKNIAEHRPHTYREMCAGLWWEDVEHGEAGPYARDFARSVTRKMPSFSYDAWSRPVWAKPEYEPGIFAAFPITGIHVIADPQGGTHEQALKQIAAANLPVEVRPE